MPTGSDDTPRVLFAATSSGEGGIERYSVLLASLLRERGISVTYACRPGTFLAGHSRSNGIPTYDWQVRNSGDIGASLQLRRYAREHRIDIIHVHSRRDYVPALLAGAPLRRHGLRMVLHAHMLRPLGDPPRLAGRFFRTFADCVICVSQIVRDKLIRAHRFPAEFVPIIPNGVDTEMFAPPDGPEGRLWRSRQRAAWGVPEDATVIGMVGRLDAKGQRELVEAIPAACGERQDIFVVLIGQEGAPGELSRLRRLAGHLGIAGRLMMPGSTEDVATAMSALDLLVHLPADESFGLVIAEAMAAGRPVIASNIGGCREVVCDGVTGLLVPLGDKEALVRALRTFLDGQAAQTRQHRFGAAGRQRVLEEFSLDAQVDRLLDRYSHLWTSTTGP